MILTPTERTSPLWHKIVKEMEERLVKYRECNDKYSLTEKETDQLRGRIREVKSILELNTPAASAPGEQ